jgi:zinc/manganese transport system substrate-binding protein
MFYQWVKKIVLIMALTMPFYVQPSYAQINVFACEPEWAALARALGGDAVKVTSATTAMQDPHHIQARPSLIAKMRRADLLVCTGADLEVAWLPLLLRKSGNARVQPGQTGYFMAADYISLLEKPTVLDRSLGDIHAAGNPHFHLDPSRIALIATALADRLAKVDSANELHYQTNLQTFNQHWQQSIENWKHRSQSLRGKRVVVSHNSWMYLESWLGLHQVATLEPKPGIPASSTHLSSVLGKIQQHPADMLLHASYQSDKSVVWLSKKTAIPIGALALSPSEGESLIIWFDKVIHQLLSVN